jgi:acetyltransferase-like isoleucine patch superfamily enzyme
MRIYKKDSIFGIQIFRIVYKVLGFFLNLYHLSRTKVIVYNLGGIGENVILDNNIYVNEPKNIKLGSNIFIGRDVFLNAYDTIEIGDHAVIAAGCKLITGNHGYSEIGVPIGLQPIKLSPITLGKDIWLGYNVIILPGVELGDGCIVAAGAVVTKSFEEYSILGGVPAKLIARRNK